MTTIQKSQATIRDTFDDDPGRDVLALIEKTELAKRVGAMLANADASSDEIRTLQTEVQQHRHELEKKWIDIRPGGPVRQRVELSGSVGALERISRATEMSRLAIDQCDRQMAALTQAREAAMAREASENLPAMIATVSADLTRLADLQTETSKIFSSLRDGIVNIGRARLLAQRAGLPAASADAGTPNRIFEATVRAGLIARTGEHFQKHSQQVAVDLGVIAPRDHLSAA